MVIVLRKHGKEYRQMKRFLLSLMMALKEAFKKAEEETATKAP